MGNFYANITLRTTDMDAAAAVLDELGRTAFVTTIGDTTVVYDAKCDDQDLKELERLARALSKRLKCAALAVCNHDDDVLWYALVENGKSVDTYESTPGYFDGNVDAPRGGDAERLCSAFGVPDEAHAVAELLRRPHAEVDVEVDRHESLRERLGLPDTVCMLGYRYVSRGELDGHEAAATLRSIGDGRRPKNKRGAAPNEMDARTWAAIQAEPSIFWDTIALALSDVDVPERFVALFGVARGNGLLLYYRLTQYVVRNSARTTAGWMRGDELLVEFLGEREFLIHSLVRRIRERLGIPPLSEEMQARFQRGDRELVERIAKAHAALEEERRG